MRFGTKLSLIFGLVKFLKIQNWISVWPKTQIYLISYAFLFHFTSNHLNLVRFANCRTGVNIHLIIELWRTGFLGTDFTNLKFANLVF